VCTDAALHEVDDLIGPGLRLLFVGINPSLLSSRTGLHFAHPGNRFYPALIEAGILPVHAGDAAAAAPELLRRGVGISNLVPRPTARADELSAEEIRPGRARVAERVARHRPRVVAIAGITAYRTAFAAPRAVAGPQPDRIEGARLWVVPNPSGLNAHATVASLGRDYRAVAEAAGLDLARR
jgi:TDG/mug DNA glycosylase family protein